MQLVIAAMIVGGIMIASGVLNKTLGQLINGEEGEAKKGENPFQSFLDSAYEQGIARSDVAGPPIPGGAGDISGGTIEAEANRMISLHLPYKWGGGHASFDRDGPWDCSGAMSWLMHHAGLLTSKTPLVSTAFMGQGEAGRGEHFTIYANPTHVFMKMESGPRAGQCWGTTSRIASKGGSLKWHDHTTAGFVARHYKGH